MGLESNRITYINTKKKKEKKEKKKRGGSITHACTYSTYTLQNKINYDFKSQF